MFGGQYLCLIKGETEARAGPSGICMVSFGLMCEAGIWTQVRLVPKPGFFPWCFPSIVVIRAKRKWSEQELLCISTSFKASLSIWLFLPLCAPLYYNDWERFQITRLALLFRRHTKRATKIPRAYIYLWCLVFLPTFSAAALLRVMGVHLRGHCLLFWNCCPFPQGLEAWYGFLWTPQSTWVHGVFVYSAKVSKGMQRPRSHM